jgi:transcriptional regulator with XRE-family HTH domain
MTKQEVFSRNLIAFRRELGDITQQDLATMAGLSVASVHRYESGKGMPERDALARLADVFGRSMDDFFSSKPPPIDPNRRRALSVRFKIAGKEPPGLRAEIVEVLRKYDAEYIDEMAKIKRQERKRRG